MLVLAERSPSASLWGLMDGASLAPGRLRPGQGDSRGTPSCRRVWSGGSSVGVRRLRRAWSWAFTFSRLGPELSPDCWG